MKPEEAIPLLQRGLVGEIYDQKGFLTALGYEALDAIDSSNCKTLVQKQHGEWKKVGGIFYRLKCSNCNFELENPDDESKFCPNCGADMREGEAE